mmetsp:Transcript_23901/g.24496  ORF Transcript_23901/g.24496 Transcript_23901/m.24496 type:complete len:590 (-) Transcript_23901:340-2109(-)|eukprot:CAMPEP_0174821188 /NCGR_PEP_ID=MMETSP1107-20130205/5913_1 /TAXON_ID=36770 /ORGANISM="Paraphysomonas vestita, Strain GFlagA" /LENGTH=589 /DNA_ID=CAMNT_0016037945 /DNA_START=54 /DNA_END=1823 /DNA_ORIENTATION=+
MKRYLGGEETSTTVEEDDTFGWKKHAFTREEEVVVAEYLLAFIVLLVTTLLLQFYVGKVWKLTYLPESGATILLGMIIGGIVRASGADVRSSEEGDDWQGYDLLGFNTTLFFIGFLPPIIFNAGYMIKRRLFFANLGGILSLAFIGTTLSAWLVGYGLWGVGQSGVSYKISVMEGLCFGSLISATDPVSTLAVFTELKVDPTLFYLVFGESVMNDAVAITLFRTTGKFVGVQIGAEEGFIAFVDFVLSFVGSVIIGYVLGLFSAWIFKTIDMSHHRLVLVSVFVGMVYIPFFLAEALQLSGIVTILFGAITARRYSAQNMPPGAKRAAAFVFEILAYLSETSVFLYIGLNVFSKASSSSYQGGFIIWTLFFIIVGRACHVYPLMAWVNWYREKRAKEKNRRPNLVPLSTQHMVFFAGLRGAVAYACANIFPDNNGNREVMVCTTMVIALITIFLKGGFTVKMLEILGIQRDVDPGPYVEKLKKQAKPYRFLLWEQKYIYPIVIKGYAELKANGLDVSSDGGSGHFGNSNHGHGGEEHNDEGHSHANTKVIADDDDDNDNGDGIQLAKGYANSTGHVPTTLVHAERDSLW